MPTQSLSNPQTHWSAWSHVYSSFVLYSCGFNFLDTLLMLFEPFKGLFYILASLTSILVENTTKHHLLDFKA